MKNRKMPTALAITMWAVIPAWTPKGSAQAGSSLPPQLQTDARREAARAARAAAASGESGGPVRRSNAAGDAAAVLGVAMDEEGLEVVKPYLGEAKVNYRVLLGNDTVAGLYGGVDSLPTSFIVDQDGRIASTHVGLVSKGDYENEISQLLDGAQRTTDARGPVLAAKRATD